MVLAPRIGPPRDLAVMVNPEWPPRPVWAQDRLSIDQTLDDGRHRELADGRRPPMQVDRALREYCGIPVRHFFLAVVYDDGTPGTFSGPNRMPDTSVNRFFSMEKYRQWLQRASLASSPLFDEPGSAFSEDYHRPSLGPGYAGRRPFERRRTQGADPFEEEHQAYYKNRKRPRGNLRRQAEDMEDDAPIPVASSRRGIKVGNSEEVWNFYDQRFKNCQQYACKLIAKAWIKTIAPKKQSTHPYTQSDEKAPDWWPKTYGPDKVRHKEPDHLYKGERVYLLKHMLRMIVEPNHKQHPEIKKLDLNVRKLEEVTNEALSAFFADKDNPNNAKKKPFLKEILKVARCEERFKNGEIDGDTQVFVMADEKYPDSYESDNDDGHQMNDEEQDHALAAGIPPQTSASQHALLPTASTDPNSASLGQTAPFMGEIPVRGSQYSTQMLPSEMGTSQHSYVEGTNMAVAGPTSIHASGGMPMSEICPPSSTSSRRTSMYSSPTEYGNPPSAGIYPAWQPNSTAPNNPSLYSFNTQQQPHQGPFVTQSGMPLHQDQHYLGASFDGMPRGAYEPQHSSMFRSGPMSQGNVPQPQGYHGYLPQDNRGLASSSMKAEPLPRGGHMQ